MLNLDTVKSDIERWIVEFVEVPHPALGGWPPCPYAKKARLEQDFDIRIGVSPLADFQALAVNGLLKSVVIFVYDPLVISHKQLSDDIDFANKNLLLEKDVIVLEDHPSDPELVNGLLMNQGKYALALCQSLSDLNSKARHMASKGFYNSWPESYLQSLFHNREDPRV